LKIGIGIRDQGQESKSRIEFKSRYQIRGLRSKLRIGKGGKESESDKEIDRQTDRQKQIVRKPLSHDAVSGRQGI
jgi:hypothetical protein